MSSVGTFHPAINYIITERGKGGQEGGGKRTKIFLVEGLKQS